MPPASPSSPSLPPSPPSAAAPRWRDAWRDFIPARLAVDARERWRVAAGAALGLLFTAGMVRLALPAAPALPWLIAPIGASAVLVFGVPASPLAQPWSVLGGNTVSALVAIGCVAIAGSSPWVAGLAVGLAIAVMFLLRCLHPPGGASALLMVLGGIADPRYALAPVALQSLLLVAAGMAYNRATGRRYPHPQRLPPPAPAGPLAARPAITDADLDVVLARYNQVLDVSRDDLRHLLEQGELQAYRRRLGAIHCADVMSRAPATAEVDTPLQQAWALLRERRIKALPVIDGERRVLGIVTLADFMRGAELDVHAGWADRLRALIRGCRGRAGRPAQAVGQIMSRQVRVASADRPIAELVPLFAATGHHHIPIIDEQQRLVGILTQSDLVAALAREA